MALIAMILLATVMSMIAAVLVVDSTTELRRSSVQVDKTSALQAAQAGIDDYLAKMAQDNLYYFHYVNRAEPVRTGSTRILSTPTPTATSTYEWLGANPWGYASPRRWVPLGTLGFEYSLKITAPSATTPGDVLATGRKVGETNMPQLASDPDRVPG